MLNELHLTNDKKKKKVVTIPTTAFLTEVNNADPGLTPVYTEEPESMEALSHSLSETTNAIVALVAQTVASLDIASTRSQTPQTDPNTTPPDSPTSLPLVPPPAQILQTVATGAVGVVGKLLGQTEQQQTVLVGEDAQLAIDALHDVRRFDTDSIGIKLISALASLCFSSRQGHPIQEEKFNSPFGTHVCYS